MLYVYFTDINRYKAAEGKHTFCFVQARLNLLRVKENNILAHLYKLSVKGNMRRRMPSLYAALGLIFL